MSEKNTPPQNETPEDEARRLRNEELFPDLDDEMPEGNDVQAAIIAGLQAENAQLTTALANAQRDSRANFERAEEATRALARVEAKAKENEQFAIQKFVKEMLPVLDTLELGLRAIPQKDRDSDPKFAKLAEGFEKALTGSLTQVFNRFGITAINPINEQFDENKHEVITAMPKAGVDPETVISVEQKGYEINGRLIRAAKVIVTPSDM